MAIADNIKLDFLWKKVIYGVTQTAYSGNITGTVKQGVNEVIPSNAIVFNSQIWTNSDDIPIIPPITNTTLIDVKIGTAAVQCVSDPSVAKSQAWLTNLKDWIPPSINSSYLVKIYAGEPNQNNLLNSMLVDYEYVFDYSAGVIYFPNNVPNSLNNGVYIEGYRYIGPKGGIHNAQNIGNGSGLYKNSDASVLNFKSLVAGTGIELTVSDDSIRIDANGAFITPMPAGVEERNLTYTTKILNPNEQETFTMNTGGVAIVELSCLDSDATLECHTTSEYNDTNPYAFKAYNGHLCDDGTTYGSSMQTIRGPRFFRIHNLDNFKAAYTYWRIINDTAETKSITFSLRTLTFGF